jgi:hypothetical protein
MKPKLSFLCLLLSASAVSILPVLSEDAARSVVKTEAQLAQERQQACYVAIESQILQHINPEVSRLDRFSRVKRPMPAQYYAGSNVSENAEGMIAFQINYIDRMALKPSSVIVATGTYNSKNGELLLKDDQSGEFVVASAHPLLKKKTNT